jgi:hypothetical protein
MQNDIGNDIGRVLDLFKLNLNLDETSTFAEGMIKEGAEMVSMKVRPNSYRAYQDYL